VSDEAVRQVEAIFKRSARKAVREGSCELQMPSSMQTGSHETLQTIGLVELELHMKWPPRSPDLTPYDFFLWGYAKEHVFVPPLPLDINELKLIITADIETVDRNMLERLWDELD
jgi:hypothetical protein